MDCFTLGTISLETALISFRLMFGKYGRGYYSNIAHTLLFFTGLVDV